MENNIFLSSVRNGLVFFGYYLPDHPAKWQIIKRISKSLRLHKVRPQEVTVVRNGITYRLDITDAMDRILYYRGVHEWLETRLCRHIIRPGFTCLDVGANLGYYTLMFAELTKERGDVHAFEPCPEEADRLRKNVSLNPFPHIKIHSLALCDYTGKTGITERRKGGNTRIAFSTHETTHQSDCMSLDEFAAAEKLDRIDFIKLDVEGAEVKCLEGGIETISRFKPVMIIELNPEALKRFGNRISEVTKILKSRSYNLYTLSQRGLAMFKRMPVTAHINAVAIPDSHIPKQKTITWKQLKSQNGTYLHRS